MRILLHFLLLLLPVFASAQAAATSPDDTDRHFWRRKQFRLGLLLQRDGKPYEYYTFKAGDRIPNYQRKQLVSGVFDWRMFPRYPGLRPQLRTGYSGISFTGDNDKIGDNRFGTDFREIFEYRHLQFAVGVQLSGFVEMDVSPYVAGHYLLAMPLRVHYRSYRQSTSFSLPSYLEVKGGGRLSQGWEISAGLNIKIRSRFLLNLGAYYTEQDMLVDWPELNGREFRTHTILRTESFGLILGGYYQL